MLAQPGDPRARRALCRRRVRRDPHRRGPRREPLADGERRRVLHVAQLPCAHPHQRRAGAAPASRAVGVGLRRGVGKSPLQLGVQVRHAALCAHFQLPPRYRPSLVRVHRLSRKRLRPNNGWPHLHTSGRAHERGRRTARGAGVGPTRRRAGYARRGALGGALAVRHARRRLAGRHVQLGDQRALCDDADEHSAQLLERRHQRDSRCRAGRGPFHLRSQQRREHPRRRRHDRGAGDGGPARRGEHVRQGRPLRAGVQPRPGRRRPRHAPGATRARRTTRTPANARRRSLVPRDTRDALPRR